MKIKPSRMVQTGAAYGKLEEQLLRADGHKTVTVDVEDLRLVLNYIATMSGIGRL